MRTALDWCRYRNWKLITEDVEAIQQDARLAEAKAILKLVEAAEYMIGGPSHAIRQRIAELERTEETK